MIPALRLHHIGIAVFEISKTAPFYTECGYRQSGIVFDPVQNVNICWLSKEGEILLELLEPVDNESPINKTLEKSGVTPYHFCYEVDDIDKAVSNLRKERFIVVSKPVPAVALCGSRVSFLYNKQVGLIELVESPAVISE